MAGNNKSGRKPKQLDLHALRKQCGLNQERFWGGIGVTQSGGSRYESGRKMPKPVEILVRTMYMDKFTLETALMEVAPRYNPKQAPDVTMGTTTGRISAAKPNTSRKVVTQEVRR